ncbi:MAG: M15 family metallopeptidase [Hyalangium sp.]|jgi:peptidoglycan L-alanyl-D-glutamate endopeptidase CwlK|uniref:M15 family metallopeptidase n=1 Tax=Hyalangium sp. TaxID=2028555 RepID=UPI00389B1B96
MIINRDTYSLHSLFGPRLDRTLVRFRRITGLDLRAYETWRSPLRQEAEYELGRTKLGPRPSAERPMGGCVTWAKPWHSLHQFGLAADLVFFVDGKWSWEEPEPGAYARLHAIAKKEGLTPLYNRKGQLIEQGHLQLASVTADELLAGCNYDDTDAWSDQLMAYLHDWAAAGNSGGPPAPIQRPEALAEAS